MDNTCVDILRERQLQMVGRLLAGFSHQLKNHLSVIKESNGLLTDLVELGRVEDPTLQDRLRRISESIDGRIRKTADMAKYLSGFAHRNDTPVSPFQLHDILDEELAFLNRFAELKSISVSISFSRTLPLLSNNAALVQFIFSSLFLFLLPTLKPGGSIGVFTEQGDGSVCIGLRPEGMCVEGSPMLDSLDNDQALGLALRFVDATLSSQSADGRIRTIICTLPLLHESH
jgi:K+-sensing histidine kinase KdpD